MTTKVEPDKKDIEQNKVTAAIGYVGVLCFVPLLMKRNSKFAQFHAKQGLMLFGLEVVSWIIPPLAFVIMVIAVIVSIMGVINALDGKYWEMPLLGRWAKKINL